MALIEVIIQYLGYWIYVALFTAGVSFKFSEWIDNKLNE